jgi:hypothetical protein
MDLVFDYFCFQRSYPTYLVCSLAWSEIESTWHVGHCLVYRSAGWCMMMNVEQSEEWELTGESEVLGEILLRRRFVHLKSHMTCHMRGPGSVHTNLVQVPRRRRTAPYNSVALPIELTCPVLACVSSNTLRLTIARTYLAFSTWATLWIIKKNYFPRPAPAPFIMILNRIFMPLSCPRVFVSVVLQALPFRANLYFSGYLPFQLQFFLSVHSELGPVLLFRSQLNTVAKDDVSQFSTHETSAPRSCGESKGCSLTHIPQKQQQ